MSAKPWKEMSRAERKVVLCQDVLARLKQEKLSANEGAYIDNLNEIAKLYGPSDLKGPVTKKDCLAIEKHCDVCARGALLLSKIRLFNSVNWEDIKSKHEVPVISQKDTTKILSEAFYREELLAIEAAFEAQYDSCNEDFIGQNEEHSWACVDFGLQYEYPDNRLYAIMENIVDNNGEFLP